MPPFQFASIGSMNGKAAKHGVAGTGIASMRAALLKRFAYRFDVRSRLPGRDQGASGVMVGAA